ncbi:MAG: DNA alkylation repair protein, partial [Candidatus Aminicenantes bacterium]|nr:DNA alkylation repair protein [Candidatus Aminicenantes bacterium]
AGDSRALKIFGYCDPGRVKITDFKLMSSALTIGETLHFSFGMKISGEKKGRVRLECAVEYQKSGGKTSKKVFKLAENDYAPGRYNFKRKQSFADMSTREHYSGTHRISIVVNGEARVNDTFELK